MADETKTCSFCGETIKRVAVKCRFCGSILDSASPERPHSSAPPPIPQVQGQGHRGKATMFKRRGLLVVLGAALVLVAVALYVVFGARSVLTAGSSPITPVVSPLPNTPLPANRFTSISAGGLYSCESRQTAPLLAGAEPDMAEPKSQRQAVPSPPSACALLPRAV